MLHSIRVAAGLGDPPSEFCTNDSEAINSSIKQFLHFKKSDWPIFNGSFVKEQHEEVCKAIFGTGQYSLKKNMKVYQLLQEIGSQRLMMNSEKMPRQSFRKLM